MTHALTLRRLRGFVIPAGSSPGSDQAVATMVAEAEVLGYAFSPELVQALRSLESDRLGRTWRSVLAALAAARGMHRTYEPLYPGFPDEVLGLSDAELYLNALAHYHSGGRWRPVLGSEAVAPSPSGRPGPAGADEDAVQPTLVGLATRAEMEAILTRLVASASPLSPTDRDDVDWFIRQYREDIAALLPATIPVRETVAVVAAGLLHHAPVAAADFVARRVTTANDVLRLAAAWSGGDASLAQPTRFASFPRPLRRLLVDILEAAPDLDEALARRPERWKRLGERLHPGERAARRPRTAAAFARLRRGEPVPTLAARVERAIAAGAIDAAVAALAERPGELARRLDALLRRHPYPMVVVDAFRHAADAVSTPVLLQLDAQVSHHLQAEPGQPRARIFLPKGMTAKLWTELDLRPPLEPELARLVSGVARDALRARFAARDSLGRVHVDPALADYPVPLAQRAASRSFRTMARGSRLPLPAAPVVRLFLWWKNGRSRTDIDLSATLFDDGFRYVDVLSYYSLRAWGGVHSGDIVDAPQGAAEFIDLDLDLLAERGVRYVAASVTSYSQQPFCDLPECFAGWMARSHPGSGEIFEPKALVDRLDLTSETRFCIPLVFDVTRRQAIWTDLGLRHHPAFQNNVHANLSTLGLMVLAMARFNRPTLHTLCTLHAESRGIPAARPEEADVVFAATPAPETPTTITPFDIDRIRTELL